LCYSRDEDEFMSRTNVSCDLILEAQIPPCPHPSPYYAQEVEAVAAEKNRLWDESTGTSLAEVVNHVREESLIVPLNAEEGRRLSIKDIRLLVKVSSMLYNSKFSSSVGTRAVLNRRVPRISPVELGFRGKERGLSGKKLNKDV
jgi:hypothetical protein